MDLVRTVGFIIQVQLLNDPFDQGLLVIRVQNNEITVELHRSRFSSEDARANRVESTDPHGTLHGFA